MLPDIEIARSVQLRPIEEIAETLGVPAPHVHPYGRYVAKIGLEHLESLKDRPSGKLVLVTAVSPTPAGEGKTTTSIGLADGLRRLGRKAVLALREPSLGPCFGMKGGATGGGYAQIAPMERINLHFTGDIHAIGTATNLLASLIDNHIYWGNNLRIDPRRIYWRRAIDLNDRSLRRIVQGLEAPSGGGVTREDGFDITVASETMAVFCLASGLADLQERLGNIIVAENTSREPVTARDLKSHGAMSVLLQDALMPNLVQTLEGTPAFVHGGPFANIAHGCNSILATRAALNTGDIAVTEAGFGADLGAEKFCDITARAGGFAPDAAVLVATVRSVKMHAGIGKSDLDAPNPGAVREGLANLSRHVDNLRRFCVPVVVALNRFPGDTDEEISIVREACEQRGAAVAVATHWAHGGAGAEELAQAVLCALGSPGNFKPLYDCGLPLFEKIGTIARTLYGAGEITADGKVYTQLGRWERQGHGGLPVCMAKTPVSFSTDPRKLGAPEGHRLHVRDVHLSAGAGFIVALCGDIMTMPGLPREPAAWGIGLDEDGQVTGLS
ncbi:MAG: formate--tetrahydrofolate ligase [Alphaproteobacteria bacterium]|nr:formate--tetrahydrofolate ligase [Alphaproteobacteria bacterium]